jgi:DNA-binding response OmpR family regulator
MKKILIIDDDVELCGAIRRTLTRAGYAVVTGHSGAAAQQLMAGDRFDLILTDILMEDGDGIELITELRRTGLTVPVIAMSGGGIIEAEDYLRMARTLGVKTILCKPFEVPQLLKLVQLELGVAAAPPPRPGWAAAMQYITPPKTA